MESLNETELAGQFANAEQRRAAFERVVRAYSPQLYAQIRRMVLTHDDAHDVLQNTFLKAWSHIHLFRGEAKLSTWLYRIALNECITFLKEQQARQQDELADPDGLVADRLAADPYFDGDATAILLQKAIQQLPEKQRMVFQMKYFQEMKYEDISHILGTTEGALKASYHYAVKKIAQFLKDHS